MSAVNERSECLRRIDHALKNGGKLARAIEALTAETHSSYLNSDIQKLVRTLDSQPTAEQFVKDGVNAAWLPLVLRAGSSSGSSGDFQLILNDLTVATEIKETKWSQFAYPMVVLAIALALFVLLATTIIPTFQSMFVEFDLKLPRATQLLLGISSYIRSKPVMAGVWLVGLMLVGIAIRGFSRVLVGYFEGSMLVGTLLSGNAERIRAMGRFTSTLAELLNVDGSLGEAILIAGRASQNRSLLRASEILSKEVGNAQSIPSGSSVAHNFPSLVFRALEAGPNATPCIPLLRQLSANYFERVKHRVDWSGGLFAPLSIIGIGICVGFTVISLFMPLVSLVTSLSG